MKQPKYLSPTSIKQWESDRQEFYIQRLADTSPDRLPQSEPMAVGAAFDAAIKSYLYYNLFGEYKGIDSEGQTIDDMYKFDVLFEKQVEPHNRDFARKAGVHVFAQYKGCGAVADLMLELAAASEPPRFEFEVRKEVAVSGETFGIPFLGKPDVYFKSKSGHHVILDFKVNGYCGQSLVSPKPGYVRMREMGIDVTLPKVHRDARIEVHRDLKINMAVLMEDVDAEWADQLSIYAWLMGETVGDPFVVGIEQITGPAARLRCASHRCRVSREYQLQLLGKAARIWRTLRRQDAKRFVFEDLGLNQEESEARCNLLDDYYKAFEGETATDKWFRGILRGGS